MGLFLRDDAPQEVTRRARSARFDTHRAITASAERINLSKPTSTQINRTVQEWQSAAWTGYKRVGEIHYGFGLLASLLSRVRLYPALVGEANESPEDVSQASAGDLAAGLADAAVEAMQELTDKEFASFIRKFSLNLSVPGECYLVHMPDADNPANKQWMICSMSEIQVTASGAVYTPMRGAQKRTLPKDTFIARMWRQDPEYSMEADSSMVGIADAVEELLLISRLTRGGIRSRLNAGVLFIPDGITTARTATTAEPPLEEPVDDISGLAAMAQQDPGNDMVSQLMDAMVTPIGDEGSAAGVVPMMLVGPTDQGAAIRHVSFERPSDSELMKRAEVALDRILQGMDIPKEIVSGMQAVKYSNAVVIDENLYKSNIEPLALVLADSLTTVYLRPILESKGYKPEEISKIVIWYDPSEIVTRPNSAESANQGVDRMVLSAKAWRRENGYAESDAPDAEEIALQLVSKGGMPEAVILQVLEKLLKGYVKVDADPEPESAPAPVAQLKAVPEKGEQDPQRVAVKQVGLK